MGLYLNPNAEAFYDNKNTKIYVDKSKIIIELNNLVSSNDDFICMSRPRRFGKSMVGNMLSAYYSKGCDTREIFSKMKLAEHEGYDQFLNKFNVIKLDLNGWYQKQVIKNDVSKLIFKINQELLKEFKKEFPSIEFEDDSTIADCILQVYGETGEKFVMIIDEYDVLVREQVPEALFKNYLSFLNSLFKDTTLRPAFALAYITGIIPVVRDKIQSKLNEFNEFTMLDAGQFAPYIGFTKEEVKQLCTDYGCDFAEFERWYDGYKLNKDVSLFNPKSVSSAISRKTLSSYWSQTGSYEALMNYIQLNFEGIREDIINMLGGQQVEVDITSYLNTLTDFRCKDDVFTYLIHLGYLSYNYEAGTCYIPNEEVRQEWVKSVKLSSDYKKLMEVINASKKLLDATINLNEDAVAKALDAAHIQATNNWTYNDEHCFQSAICLAYFYANTRYTVIKELPTGKGYADLALIPFVPNIPAMVIELKHNKSTESALQQIRDKQYDELLRHYRGDLLFVGINYDEQEKSHSCKIEKLEIE